MSVSEKLGNGYLRVSSGWAFVLAVLASLALAFVTGLLGGIAAMYLYACLFLATVATVFFSDGDSAAFTLGDWLAILVFGLFSLLVCRRWYA